MSALDRDAARGVLNGDFVWNGDGEEQDAQLDALEGCVRPGPPHTIDQWQLWQLLPGDTEQKDSALAVVLALLRPVEGVVLTREEAAKVLMWKRAYDHRYGSDVADESLHERLQAAS